MGTDNKNNKSLLKHLETYVSFNDLKRISIIVFH